MSAVWPLKTQKGLGDTIRADGAEEERPDEDKFSSK